jgi:hypothetical protein
VLVNGHTGEVVGDRPVSKVRVGIAIGAGVALLVVILVLYLLFS